MVDEIHKLMTINTLNKAGLSVTWLRARSRWGLTATPGVNLSRCRLYAQMLYGIPTRQSAEQNHMHHFVRYPAQYTQSLYLRSAYSTDIMPAMQVKVDVGAMVMPTITFHHTNIRVDADWMQQYHETMRECRRVVRQSSGMRVNLMLNRILMAISGVRAFERPTLDEYGQVNPDMPEVPPDVFDCAICLQALNRPMKTQCDHYFCRDCIAQWTSQSGNCPLCRTRLTQPSAPCAFADNGEPTGPVVLSPSLVKMQQICADIVTIVSTDTSHSADENERAPNRLLCFSRFPDVRNAIMASISPIVSCTASVQAFQADSSIAVLILSMSSCAVGLNLMQANHVVLCEPSFKRANDEQAYGRAARIGQQRMVHVHRYIAENTVEDRVFQETRDASRSSISMRSVFDVDDE